jgi:hypothetical protein
VPGGGKGAVFGIGYFNKRDSLGCETMGLGNASTIMPRGVYWTADLRPILSGVGMLVSRTQASSFAIVLIRTPNENSLLTLEAPEKRESESSGPIFRTGGCNLEGCVRETEISLQTENAAVWAGEPRKA